MSAVVNIMDGSVSITLSPKQLESLLYDGGDIVVKVDVDGAESDITIKKGEWNEI